MGMEEDMLAEINTMMAPSGYDYVVVCCSNLSAENYWQARLEQTIGEVTGFAGKVVCVALGLTVTDAWCQSNFEAAGGRSFHNAQCKCADPTVALRNVDPALAAAAAANAAVAKQAAISEP